MRLSALLAEQTGLALVHDLGIFRAWYISGAPLAQGTIYPSR